MVAILVVTLELGTLASLRLGLFRMTFATSLLSVPLAGMISVVAQRSAWLGRQLTGSHQTADTSASPPW